MVTLVAALTVFGFVTYSNASQLEASVFGSFFSSFYPKAAVQTNGNSHNFLIANNPLTSEAPLKGSAPEEDVKSLEVKDVKESKDDAVSKILAEYASREVPEALLKLYPETDIANTVKKSTEKLGKFVLSGSISETKVEEVMREVFSTAVADTGEFAINMLGKESIRNFAEILIKDPKNAKAIKAAIENEFKNYAKQEVNKLANQVFEKFTSSILGPAFAGVEFDFTKPINSKTIKTTLRSMIINAMAQSYLGPQYVALYTVVSVACPSCMVKTQAELKRFDKSYLQPVTGKIANEYDRFEDVLKTESKRIGNQVKEELNRLKGRVSAELGREKGQVVAEVNRANEHFNAELKRAQDSKIGKEIERELTDYYETVGGTIDRFGQEMQREYEDVAAEGERVAKRYVAELRREINSAKNELNRYVSNTKNQLKKQVKSVASQAQSFKNKVEAELKRAADKVEAELKRAADKVKAETNRVNAEASRAAKNVKKFFKKI